MTVVWILIGFIASLWIYTVVVTEPPYGLDRTPKTTDEITFSEIGR